MMFPFRIACLAVLCLGDPPAPPNDAAPKAPRKLIEFGWDEPDTAFLHKQIGEMARTPFDGCVFHVMAQTSGRPPENFTWLAWGTRTFRREEFQQAIADLEATSWGRFTENFLRFNTTPGRLDWFDDHAAVLANARLAAEVARRGHGRGILFDIEQYEGQLFDFAKQRDAKTLGFDAYAKQVRQRGREVMEAFQDGFPDLTILLTFGPSLPWSQSQRGAKPLAECSYGLLAPFLDGMIEAARGRTTIVDGYETSYGYRKSDQFREAAETMRERIPETASIVSDAKAYRARVRPAFGIWLDYDWRSKGWDIGDPSKNYFTPEGFAASVRAALEATDRYVWIYTETPRWWTENGGSEKLPSAYVEALNLVRKSER